MTKFKNKYRSESHRHPNWDYSANALYFLTIVTQYRVCNLGKIENGEMILSDFGSIVEAEWYKSFDIRKELFLDEFIMMPNHLHAIVEINNHGGKRESDDADATPKGHSTINTTDVGTTDEAHQPIKRNPPVRLPESISSFIAGFKSSVNSKIDDYIDEKQLKTPKYNRNNHFFQPNYNDHIVRDEREYWIIKNYIINNPLNWEKDKLNGAM
jgi:putative transposase